MYRDANAINLITPPYTFNTASLSSLCFLCGFFVFEFSVLFFRKIVLSKMVARDCWPKEKCKIKKKKFQQLLLRALTMKTAVFSAITRCLPRANAATHPPLNAVRSYV